MKSVIALLQFCTPLPLGRPVEFEQFARRSYLYPLAGYVIGGIAAGIVSLIASPVVGAAVAVAAVLVLSGCNHFDGLLDFGDGLMAHGSREKRVAAMTDRTTGAGALATGIVVTLIAFAGLQTVAYLPAAILTAEVCAKVAMSYLTTLGVPFREGIHSYLHGFARPWFLVPATLLALPLFLLPIPGVSVALALSVTVIIVALMLSLSRHLFGGVNGDVVGATNEITRAGVILILALL
ncbi:MAG: adenosylcobinamide-GDP ribazoletransferase [Methanoculleus sp.]|uniref:adenosylcobinamide-GDP ribazoletransferase n=1 Tax=unclassified Methanoculleus TaxID=2619537 RepID=UPI0025F545FB|nr:MULTISPECIES: adenosylcobinamide-GDP ribazoletransferase [unclassified Methanoculleus]MCK9318698.1 adenosylcobinamide-GDP ribazoletransferase [Methanoculleus sp.]MDD2254465.1 adenosylcobinamide-GDP ribazoletransferase [Methanoculleus sp.]MDD3216688.1 adenosylcobinamide-GDP ribazoletransferase [Methanoculleus sp.]MDD4315073.1 adenosylcobinamide-GDP ribazoletransferase [Methanoculleus sp.]MDD4471601.1 adenosylcobinamide-GDP ribazoletransferase [Methanoculleus sp.]